jgi:acetyl esterase/lipase
MSLQLTVASLVLFPAIAAFAADKDYTKECFVYPEVIYGHKHSLAMTMDIIQPKKGNRAGIVFVVSGAWHSVMFSPWAAFSSDCAYSAFFDCRVLFDKGYTVFFVRHGDGSKFTKPEIVDDCRHAIRFIRFVAPRYDVDPDRLGALGASAGGHLALMLASTSDEGRA